MDQWKRALIPRSSSIREALQAIDSAAIQIALVVGEDGRLHGTVTDGDVRRGILRGISLDDSVERVMNGFPTVARTSDEPATILAIMKLKQYHQIPVVDDDGRVIGLELLDALIQEKRQENWVLLMAGGLGTRLGSLTRDCPKPLLSIGGKPILETIINEHIQQGFSNFYLAVNYKAEMIMDYFGDGSKWGITIRYLLETEQMGTAGALALLPEKPVLPLIVMNGDLLTKTNFRQMLDFHNEHKAAATMGVREYHNQIPYGVVEIDRGKIVSIEEKPRQSFFVSAGIYIISPEVVDMVPGNSFVEMPQVFQALIERGMSTSAYPIREYWLDVGRIDDFNRAGGEFERVFG